MLNLFFNQKQLLTDACTRLDNCDDLLLLRAFKRLSNTEVAALISTLPVHHSNQILIILPADTSRRILSMGFIPEKMNNDILRKLIASIDREIDLIQIKSVELPKNRSRLVGPVDEKTDIIVPFQQDQVLPASMRLLDAVSRFFANSFNKH